jgi:diacylglycerol kinase (ATP)
MVTPQPIQLTPEPPQGPVPVIVNPKARSARAGGRIDDIRSLSGRVELHETSGIGNAGQLAEDLARAGAPLIVAAGGDGTVNEVVNGIVRAGAVDRTVLGVLPTGTMNVFAAELGLPSARLDECWRAITGGIVREVDLWRLNDTFFVQLAGVGMDAAIIRETTWESKKRFGPLSYILSGMKLLRRPTPPMRVTGDGVEPVEGTVVLVGNGRNYGGPFPFFPDAVAGDGLLDVVVMPQHGVRDFYAVGRALLSGRYAPQRGVRYFQTASLRVEAIGDVPFEVDGELAGAAAVLNIAWHGKMQVMAPLPAIS